MRMTKARFVKVKKELVRYQKSRYPQLSYSLPNHGLGLPYESDEKYWTRKRGIKSQHRKLQELIEQTLHLALSEQEFWAALRERDVLPYIRRGRLLGIRFQGKKYRFETLELERRTEKELDITGK